MNNRPLVSIIMPSYNRANKLNRSIKSVLNQSYQNWELLVVDDMSTDNTIDVISQFQSKDDRIKYLPNHRKKGPSGARNTGLLAAKGDFIAFLDSDDEFMPHHLEDSISVLEKEKLKLTFSLWIQEQEGRLIEYDKTEGWRDALNHAINTLQLQVNGNVITFNDNFYEYNIHHPLHCYCICTMVFHKDILDSISLFNEKIFGGEDTDFMYRVFQKFNFCLIDNHHFIYYQGSDNLFNFIDWGKLDIDQVVQNKKIIQRVIFNMKHEITVRKLRHHQIRASNTLQNKKSCLKANKNIIAQGYEILAYVYSHFNIIKQSYYRIKSFLTRFHLMKIFSRIIEWKPRKNKPSQKPRIQSVQIRNDLHISHKSDEQKVLLNTLS